MVFLYNLVISFYYLGIRLAALFGNKKANQWIRGRKTIFEQLERALSNIKGKPIIWMHVASLGEFEQGRPVIEAIKSQFPTQKILLTFFSPSGYEIRKEYNQADYVFYLPLDTARNARRFLDLVQPTTVIFVKYDLWYHYLTISQKRKIPTLLISALFRPTQLFFKPYGSWYKQVLQNFTHIFVHTEESQQLLSAHQITNTTLAGDNRVDRVWAISQQPKQFPIVAAFTKGCRVLVCGSTWQPDEILLFQYFKKYQTALPFKIIIAPHQIDKANIDRIVTDAPISIMKYSEATEKTVLQADILLIDNIGMLSSLYQYGDIAYIGGGFTHWIHNTLEPIAFGLPVIFGKRYDKFEEAKWLIQEGGGFSITNEKELIKVLDQLLEEEFYRAAARQAKRYIDLSKGATTKVMQYFDG